MVLPAGTPVLRVALDGPRDVVFSVPEDRWPSCGPAGQSARRTGAVWGQRGCPGNGARGCGGGLTR